MVGAACEDDAALVEAFEGLAGFDPGLGVDLDWPFHLLGGILKEVSGIWAFLQSVEVESFRSMVAKLKIFGHETRVSQFYFRGHP